VGDDSETTSTAEWATAFCSAVTDWTDDGRQVGDAVSSSPSVDSLEQAAEDLSTATDEFADEIQSLGAPDTESSEQIEAAIADFDETVQNEKAEVEEAVDDAEDTTGLTTALGIVGGSLQAMATSLQETFQAFENADVGGELEAAFEESAACQEIGG
jgi:methyl-accepting chemotaxis protein